MADVPVKLPSDTFCELADLATLRGITVIEEIRRMAALERLLWNNPHMRLVLTDGNHDREIILLP